MSDKTAVPMIPQGEKRRSVIPQLLTNRRALLLVVALVAGSGLALNWNWLVAAGIAPILIAALTCLVMCGLGLCMHKMTGSSCEDGTSKNGEPK